MNTLYKHRDIPKYKYFQKLAPEKKLPRKLSPAFTDYMVKLKLVAVVHIIEYSSAILRHTTIFSKPSS